MKTAIIGGIAIIVLVLIGLNFMKDNMNPGNVNINQNLDGSTTYSNDEGSATINSQSMPEDWPADAPQNYTGATITFSGSSNPQTGESGAAIVYTVNANAQTIADYYKTELERNGWQIEGNATSMGTIIISASKDTKSFGVSIVGAEGTSTVTASVSEE